MAHLYSNENFPLPVVEVLRGLGHDVLTSHEAGQANQGIPDEDVLTYAVDADRAILTINRKHFIRLHTLDNNHHGIIVCTIDPDFAGQAQRIHDALTEADDLTGQLLRVNRPLQVDPAH